VRVRCFSCGRAVALAAGERVGFRDACEACRSDLHVCRNCRHHDPSVYNECREPNAERVGDRDRANRCDYFSPGERAAADAPGASAKAKLDALFRKG
jgi:hypothetical protein